MARMPKKSGHVSLTVQYIAKKTVYAKRLPPITRDTPNLLEVLSKHRKMRLAKETL